MTRRMLMGMLPLAAQPKALTAGEVIARIQKAVAVPWRAETVDTLKAGTPETVVTGIATTFMSTLDVLQRAAAEGKNMVITHEPTFYAHDDSTRDTGNDATVQAKKRFIEEHKMAVFRFHDHWHARRPDGIRVGMESALGWTPNQTHQTTLKALARDIKARLQIRAIRVIGDPDQPVRRVAFNPGYANLAGAMRAISNADVLVIGEAREWEVYEYVQDQIASGARKSLIVLGHAVSEEAGMRECAAWLKPLMPEVPVGHVPAGEPFWTL